MVSYIIYTIREVPDLLPRLSKKRYELPSESSDSLTLFQLVRGYGRGELERNAIFAHLKLAGITEENRDRDCVRLKKERAVREEEAKEKELRKVLSFACRAEEKQAIEHEQARRRGEEERDVILV